MTSVKSPAFQFYPGDFLSDIHVALMSAQEVGAYLLLMSHCWLEGALPDDMETLAHLARMAPEPFVESWNKRIGRCFELSPDGWTHPRLQAEREKQQAFSRKMSEAATRRHAGSKQALPTHKQKQKSEVSRHQVGNALQFSSSSSSTTPISPSGESASEPVGIVAAHYLAAHPKRRIGAKDRTAIRKALALGYSSADLCEAIDGNASDDWHRDKRKHELPYVLRDTGKIDDFRAKAQDANQPLVDEHGVLTAYGERVTRP